jgi:hypothetical protein
MDRLSPSLANGCNPLLQAHPPWAQDNMSRGSLFPPLCSISRRPIWAGTRSDNLLVGPGTPRGRNADNFIRHCWCLGFELQKPSDVSLQVLLMILCALEHGLSSYRLRLKPLETCDQHIFQFLSRCYCSWPERGVTSMSNTPNRHYEGLGHDGCIATIGRYGCFVAHEGLLWV